MRLSNFRFGADDISIQFGDLYVDLHNNFDFTTLTYDLPTRELTITWTRNTGDWVPESTPKGLSMVIENVSRQQWGSRDDAMPLTEDACVSFIGLLSADKWQVMDAVSDSRNGDEDLIVRFQSELTLKVRAKSARIVIAE